MQANKDDAMNLLENNFMIFPDMVLCIVFKIGVSQCNL